MCEGWEGAASRVIRKPEDLSECRTDASWREALVHIKSEDKKRDIPGLIFSIRGFFFGGPHHTPMTGNGIKDEPHHLVPATIQEKRWGGEADDEKRYAKAKFV